MYFSADGLERIGHAIFDEYDDLITDVTAPSIRGYVIYDRIGSGGEGDVYQATQMTTMRDMAIKLLHTPDDNSQQLGRVMRELDVLSTLNIPNVPRVVDFGIQDGQVYIVSDLINGIAIDKYCEREDLDLKSRVQLMADLARVVHKLHGRGVIHRDLKPSNILIDQLGNPHLVDLGIAIREDSFTKLGMANRGVPVGTVPFMAPEQARGESTEISTRSDIYGLGATLFYLLTGGETPHDPDVSATKLLHLVSNHAPRDILTITPSVDPTLARIVHRALAFLSEDRHESAAEFADDLERWLRGEPIVSQSPPIITYIKYWCKTKRITMGVTGLILVLLISVVISTIFAIDNKREAEYQEQIAGFNAQLVIHQEELTQNANQQLERNLQILRGRFVPVLESGIKIIRSQMTNGRISEGYDALRAFESLVLDMRDIDPYLDVTEPLYNTRHEMVIAALQEIYSINEKGGDIFIDRIETIITELEQERLLNNQ